MGAPGGGVARRPAPVRAAVASAVVGVLLVLLVLLGACTSAGPGPTTSAAPTTPSAPAAAPSTSSTGTSSSASPTLTVTLPGGSTRVWSLARLLALPRTTVTAADGSTVAAVSLPTLTGYDAPAGAADPRLRVVYRVSGTGTPRAMTFARAESEPSVGDHPALLTLSPGGRLDVVVPQDRTTARSVLGVDAVVVSVLERPAPASPLPPTGSVEVVSGGTRRTLDASALPRRDYTLARPGAAPTRQQGVRLTDVLQAAGVRLGDASVVTVLGSSGQVAVVTGGEVTQAQKEVGLSFAQDGRPLARSQLVVGGDVTAARTVASVTTIVVQG